MIDVSDVSSIRIDGGRYFDRRIMDAESEGIWRKSWLLAALESDLRAPKSLVVFDIGPDSIAIARSADGALHAYHNACTHRGTRLLEEGPGRPASSPAPITLGASISMAACAARLIQSASPKACPTRKPG